MKKIVLISVALFFCHFFVSSVLAQAQGKKTKPDSVSNNNVKNDPPYQNDDIRYKLIWFENNTSKVLFFEDKWSRTHSIVPGDSLQIPLGFFVDHTIYVKETTSSPALAPSKK